MGIELRFQILSLNNARRYHRSKSQLVPNGAEYGRRLGYNALLITKGESMAEVGEEFSTIEDAIAFDLGKRVAFTIKTISGKELRIHCALAQLGDIFSYLGRLAQAAGQMRNAPQPATGQGHNYFAPIPAEGIGLQASDNPDETLLVVRLTGFDMAFSVESNEIVTLADDFVRAARTLKPDRTDSLN